MAETHEGPSRTETDSMGPIEVAADRYWGAQTQRSLHHFTIGGDHMPSAVVRGMAVLKKAAALTNRDLDKLSSEHADLIRVIETSSFSPPSPDPAGIAWDPTEECYREFYLNNMGETGVQELRFVDDTRLVTTLARLQGGEPEATRGTVHLDDTGSIVKVSMDRMNAGNAPERAFLGEYKKLGKLAAPRQD